MKAVNHSTFRKATQIAIEKKDSKILLFAKCLKSPIALKEFAMIQIKENRMSFFKSGEKVKAFHLKNLRNPSKLLF